MKLNRTQKYEVRLKEGAFRIFVSKVPAGEGFVASLLYYTKLERSDGLVLNSKLEHFFNNKEETVLEDCLSWVSKKWSSNFRLRKLAPRA